MAKVLKLKHGATEFDLTSSTGFQLEGAEENWLPRLPEPAADEQPPPLLETMMVVIQQAADHDTLAGSVQAWSDMEDWSVRYMKDRHEVNPVWLHHKLTNETNERRCLVRRIDSAFASGPSARMIDQNAARMAVAIERSPYWEGTADVTMAGTQFPNNVPVLSHDYTVSPAADIVGDVGARVPLLVFGGSAFTPSADGFDRLWIGIRSESKHPGLAAFNPLWDWGAPGHGFGTADTNAVGGTSVYGAWGTSTTTWSVFIQRDLDSIASAGSEGAFYGNYLWLSRMKVAAGTVDVRLVWEGGVEGPPIRLTNTTWDIFESGVHDIPAHNTHAIGTEYIGGTAAKDYTVYLQTRSVNGASGTLWLDCLGLIPIDEGSLIIKGAGVTYQAQPLTNELIIGCGPADVWSAVAATLSGGTISGYGPTADVSMHNFYLPAGDGRLIMAYAQATTAGTPSYIYDDGPVFGGENVSGYTKSRYIPRWRALRGSE